ncbi:glycosyltransferase family 2 protein [Brachyspira pilosicoli]
MKILVFIPMYNCEKQIPRVISQFDEETQKLFAEILIVDNISKDSSLLAAEEALKKLSNIKTTLIQNEENVSLGGSHKVAFNYAIDNGYDYVIVLHGDDQGSIKDIVPYIKDETAFKYDAFLGARFMKGSKTPGYDKIRIIGNYAVNLFISIFLRKNIKDMGSGLNMFKIEILKNKFYLPFRNDLTFNVYLLFYLIYYRINFKFFPLTWREDDQISNAKVFKQGMHIINMTFKYVFNAKILLMEENSKNNFNYKIIYKN